MLIALLASVYLNGVNVDGLRSQSFEKCKAVKIDEHGDVRLECPGYQVQQQASAPAAAAVSGAITRHYWLVSEEKDSAATQYDVDVFVNSRWVRKIKAGEPQLVLEITRFVQPGPNRVLFAAVKQPGAGRKGASDGSFVRFTVGEGRSHEDRVEIDDPLVECKRTAAETGDVNEEFTIQGR
jgi:hypothetical protein